MMVSFDEPSKPVKRKPPVLSSQKKKAAQKDNEEESPKKDEGESPQKDEGASLSVSFDEPSKPVKKKPVLSSQKRTVQKKTEDTESEPPAAPEPKPTVSHSVNTWLYIHAAIYLTSRQAEELVSFHAILQGVQ